MTKYIASVDRSCFPAHVSQGFDNKAAAIAWAVAQGGYNATVYVRQGWTNVWSAK